MARASPEHHDNPQDAPHVSHQEGTELAIEYIER
jgi:hypothetical protein